MGAWRGDPSNPVPFFVQEPISRAEKVIKDNRSKQVRRDTDTQRDFTISLEDIDATILHHLQNLQIQVDDNGQKIKVPIFFGSPEKWTAAQRDGYMRDQQGKIILPAIVLKRTTSANDETLQFFNRYLETSVMKLYSNKNKYTRFNLLAGKNAPINEVYNIVVPSHMLLTYNFMIWTELVEQQNKIVETIQFNTKDYWGSEKGFRFRTRVDSFGHTVELQDGDDRAVRTEFQLTTHGYILPDTMTKLERQILTTQKLLTPKKIVMNMEVVESEFDFSKKDKDKEKWRNWKYPNLQRDVFIQNPPMSIDSDDYVNNIPTGSLSIPNANTSSFLYITPAPSNTLQVGSEYQYAADPAYVYFYGLNSGWHRTALSTYSGSVPSGSTEGQLSYDSQYLYIYISSAWRRTVLSTSPSLTISGTEGDIFISNSDFFVYSSGSWRSTSLSIF